MMQEKIKSDFIPNTIFKPVHKVTYLGYEITSNGKNIEFDARLFPERFDLKDGDMFVAKVTENNSIVLERAEIE